MIGRLGRALTPELNRGTWWFGSYVPPHVYDAPPLAQHHAVGLRHRWWMNNQLSCCTISAIAKIIAQRCDLIGKSCTITDGDIVTAYSKATGYVPGDPTTDNGGQMKNALKVACTTGIGGYKLTGYVRVNTLDIVEMRAALWFGLSLYVGADLPRRVLEQTSSWYIPTKPDERDRIRSLGGHALPIFGADHDELRAVPWIDEVGVTHAWDRYYIDEGYVLIDDMLLEYLRGTSTGFDVDRFRRNIAALQGA